MLILIILSFIDWRCGWGVFCTCEYEHFTCTCIYGKECTFDSFFALNSTHIIYEGSNLINALDHRYFRLRIISMPWYDANTNNPEFYWLVSIAPIGCTCVGGIVTCMCSTCTVDRVACTYSMLLSKLAGHMNLIMNGNYVHMALSDLV